MGRVKFTKALFNSRNDRIWRRSSGCYANAVISRERVRKQFSSRLNMVHACTKLRAGFDQFVRVIAVRTADDHDHIALLCEFHGGVLPLFGRLADGVNKTNFGTGEPFAEHLREPADFFNRLGRLRHDPKTRTLLQIDYFGLGQHHREFIQIFRHAAHFDVVTLANDDGVNPSSTSLSRL